VNQTRLAWCDVPTASLSLLAQVGAIPGAPGARPSLSIARLSTPRSNPYPRPVTIRWPSRLTRNAEAPWLFESFFVAAVASFLGIRWFLALTGYPRIGSNGIHIAHMLWGGLLMLLALLLLLGFLDRSIQHVAAAIAGLGFGTFIDEIGKFVTADNDYFYRPAVALVYVAFVVAFLVARSFVGERRLTRGEALANALHALATSTEGPIEPDDRARIARLLARADPEAPGTRLIERYLADLPGKTERRNLIETVRDRLARGYEAVMARPLAERALTVVVVAYAAIDVIGVGLIATASGGLSAAAVAQLGSTIVGAALVGWGVVELASSRVVAYRWFMRGILVWILITQVFVFYSSQLAGLGGLALDLLAYGSLRFAIVRELVAGRDRPGTGPRRA
jgi:hypothetical protein